MPSCKGFCNTIAWYVFDYTTPKIVTVRSFKVGLINRLVQLIILAYIIGYVIVYKKGYQINDVAQSTVTTKVKGLASTLHRRDLPEVYRRVWDTSDYVVPPQESNAFFVMTNAIITPGQQINICPESYNISDGRCKSDNNCVENKPVSNGNGIETGKCNLTTNTCEIHAWCPVENDTLPSEDSLLPQAENFTVLIKNFIEFPRFGKDYKKRNVVDAINNGTYLKGCHYNQQTDPFCPVFELGYIVRRANANFRNLAKKGGVISIIIKWDCDLDYGLEYCLPKYEFNRLDNEHTQIAPGWNFRFSKQYRSMQNTPTRDLYKAYGILFVFSVQGTAGKFNPVPLFINIGSGLALLALATIVCDVVMLYLLKQRKFYRKKKYLSVIDTDFARLASRDDDEAVNILPSDSSTSTEDRLHTSDNHASSLEYI